MVCNCQHSPLDSPKTVRVTHGLTLGWLQKPSPIYKPGELNSDSESLWRLNFSGLPTSGGSEACGVTSLLTGHCSSYVSLALWFRPLRTIPLSAWLDSHCIWAKSPARTVRPGSILGVMPSASQAIHTDVPQHLPSITTPAVSPAQTPVPRETLSHFHPIPRQSLLFSFCERAYYKLIYTLNLLALLAPLCHLFSLSPQIKEIGIEI